MLYLPQAPPLADLQKVVLGKYALQGPLHHVAVVTTDITADYVSKGFASCCFADFIGGGLLRPLAKVLQTDPKPRWGRASSHAVDPWGCLATHEAVYDVA